jgi:glutamyl-tRNA synthetase
VAADQRLAAMCALFKDRCSTTVELADWLAMYFVPVAAPADELAAQLTDTARPALAGLRTRLADLPEADWNKAGIAQALKATLAEHQLKMPQLAIPLRLLLCGRAQTPSVDAVVALFDRDTVLARLQHV